MAPPGCHVAVMNSVNSLRRASFAASGWSSAKNSFVNVVAGRPMRVALQIGAGEQNLDRPACRGFDFVCRCEGDEWPDEAD